MSVPTARRRAHSHASSIAANTWRSPTGVSTTAMPAAASAWCRPRFDITVTTTALPASAPRAASLARPHHIWSPSTSSPCSSTAMHPIGVTVEREAERRASRAHLVLERPWVGRAAAGVDVRAVGVVVEHVDARTGGAKHVRRALERRAIGRSRARRANRRAVARRARREGGRRYAVDAVTAASTSTSLCAAIPDVSCR